MIQLNRQIWNDIAARERARWNAGASAMRSGGAPAGTPTGPMPAASTAAGAGTANPFAAWLARFGADPLAGSRNAAGKYIGGNQNLGLANDVVGFPQFANSNAALNFVRDVYSPSSTLFDALHAPGGLAAANDKAGNLSPFSVANVDEELKSATGQIPGTTDAGNPLSRGLVAVPSSTGGGESGNASGDSFTYPTQSLADAQNTVAQNITRAERGGYPMLDTGDHILNDVLQHVILPVGGAALSAGLGEFLAPAFEGAADTSGALDAFASGAGGLGSGVASGAPFLSPELQAIANFGSGALKDVAQQQQRGLARGGVVPGPRPSNPARDNTVTTAQGGEVVMNEELSDLMGRDHLMELNELARKGATAAQLKRTLHSIAADL